MRGDGSCTGFSRRRVMRILVLVTVCLGGLVDGAGIHCRDEDGTPVDWFVAYKIPLLKHSTDPIIAAGLGHTYLDPSNPVWRVGVSALDDPKNAIGRTIQQIYDNYDNRDSVAYAMYNDQPPHTNPSLNHGHTKGVLAFDGTSGFWLVHSQPKFPNEANMSYDWPTGGHANGQTFLCISLAMSTFQKIGVLFNYTYPKIYDSNLPTSFANKLPALAAAFNMSHVDAAPWFKKVSFPSLGGQMFYAYVKFDTFGEDMFSTWMAPDLAANLYVETWQNTGGKLLSNCTGKFRIENINLVNLTDAVSFDENRDHAKWCIAQSGNASIPWTCIGDINRATGQMHRAGGMICFTVHSVWRAFTNSVAGVETCMNNNI